jgi:hypothetical protein
MEDDLKILKVEYLISPFWDHTQILNLILDEQKYFKCPQNEDNLQWKMTCNGRQPAMEDNGRLPLMEDR